MNGEHSDYHGADDWYIVLEDVTELPHPSALDSPKLALPSPPTYRE